MKITKSYFIAIITFFSCTGLHAQKLMNDVWINIPDSLMKYLNWDKRNDLVAYYNMGAEASIPSLLDEKSILLKLTDNYISLRLNQSSTMQMALLSTDDEDSLICMVRTYIGGTKEEDGAAESVITFYDMQWNRLDNARFLTPLEGKDLVNRPDTMSQEQYDLLVGMAHPQMLSVEMDETDLSLTYRLTVPMLAAKEREQLNSILLQRKLKWNGKIYN